MIKLIKALCGPQLREQDNRNERQGIKWGIAWVISLAAAGIPARLELYDSVWITLASTAVNLFFAMGFLRAYKNFITGADELERKIQLEALALACAGGLLVFSGGTILFAGGLIPEPNAATLLGALGISYIAGIVQARLRYA
ncbi:hypothetical protein [Microbulbifer agarilyticus]